MLKNNKKYIKILGAGISGLVAANILTKNGYGVEVFEKRSRIGSYFKKDVHSLRNYIYDYDIIEKYKELGIEISNFQPIFKELRFVPSGKNIEIYSDNKPLFYNVLRGYKDERSIDNELFKQAQIAGVNFIFNQNKNINDPNIDIVATGAQIPKGIAYGRHYKNFSTKKLDAVYYLLNNKIAPRGYIYIAPFLDEVSIVIATTKIETKKNLKQRYETMVKNNKFIQNILRESAEENEVFGFAYFDLPDTAVKRGKIFIGEAAGFSDAATGFGTHYAILSGYLAAKAIIDNEDYDKLWKKWFGEELKERCSKRLLLEKTNDKIFEKNIADLLKIYGQRISIEDYRKYI